MALRVAAPLPSLLLLTACQGVIGPPASPDGVPPPPSPAASGSPRPSASPSPSASPRPTDPDAACDPSAPLALADLPLRRLTSAQYTATVRDLLGDPEFAAPLDDDAQVITERGVRQLRDAAEQAIARQADWTRDVFPCDPAGARDEACARALITELGGRAFRRPVTADEHAGLMDVYRATAADLTFAESLEVLVEVILQSPQLVYVDDGDGSRAPGTYALDGWSVASRLSYFLWGTMPDDLLFQAAAAGRLDRPAGVRAEAERMLADPRAAATIERFVWRWLQLDGGRLHHALEEAIKDDDLFPEYGAALQAAMRTELEALVRRVILDERGTFADLLESRWAYVNEDLAELYGVEDGPEGDDWAWVQLDDAQRAGLLTRAAFLTVFASAKVQSPIRRGVFVIEELLCGELGDPPPNANDVPVVGGTVEGPDGEEVTRTVRQDVEARTSGDGCAGCHSVINPTGFAFERFDAIGRHRTSELGTRLPIDSSGALRGAGPVDGPVTDALDLSRKLARSPVAQACFARRWASAALGQPLHAIDRCFVEQAAPRFFGSGSVRDLILDLVTSEAFRSVVIGAQ